MYLKVIAGILIPIYIYFNLEVSRYITTGIGTPAYASQIYVSHIENILQLLIYVYLV